MKKQFDILKNLTHRSYCEVETNVTGNLAPLGNTAPLSSFGFFAVSKPDGIPDKAVAELVQTDGWGFLIRMAGENGYRFVTIGTTSGRRNLTIVWKYPIRGGYFIASRIVLAILKGGVSHEDTAEDFARVSAEAIQHNSYARSDISGSIGLHYDSALHTVRQSWQSGVDNDTNWICFRPCWDAVHAGCHKCLKHLCELVHSERNSSRISNNCHRRNAVTVATSEGRCAA